MRHEDGLSLTEISVRVQVSKSTVSRWVRDIVLTEMQVRQLASQNPVYNGQFISSQLSKSRARSIRRAYQAAGRERAKHCNPVHMAGCMLYWAEGEKSRCSVGFTNSDPEMLTFFLHFLMSCYEIKKHEVTVSLNCFDDQVPVKEIEEFWIERLDLPRNQLRKTTLNYLSCCSQHKRVGKLKYGTCRISVHRTEIVQNIYGAIQEYAGIPSERWLD